MNPEDKKEESKDNPDIQTQKKEGKPQRKLRFKTLDGNIKNLECDFDIKISELKKKLAEIYKIEPNRQRLLNKGKQFKDDEYLDKLVTKDDTIIHLVFRSEADVKQAQENAQNNNNANQTQTQNQNQNNQNVNPFHNILNIVTNSDQFRNMTNNIVSQIFANQGNSNNNNNNTNHTSSNIHTINIGNTQFQALNVGEALNLANSPLHPIVQPPNLTTPPPLNLNNNNNNNQNQSQNQNQNGNNNQSNVNLNNKNYSGQFPITPSVTDKKYEAHLKNIEKELNSADELMSNKTMPRIPLPLLNTTQNVFTAISRSLRKYVIVNQNILCHLMYLADLMEREQFISNSDTRMTGNKLLDKAYKSLLHIGQASKDLSNVIKSSNFNTAPNTGYIGVICQEVGYHASPISINSGELDPQNILSALRGANRNNTNNNSNNNVRNINTTINSGNQGQNTVTEINATIPLNIVEVTVEEGGNDGINVNVNNVNNNATNNQTQNIPSTTATTATDAENKNNQQKEEEKNKKEDNSKPNEPKEKEKEKESDKEKQTINDNNNNNNTQTNINQNNTSNNNTNTQNNTQNAGNNFNNLLGNMMNQLMRPENINSITGAVGSMLNNPNQSGGGNNNPMGLFGNLFSNLMSSLGEESDDEEEERNVPPENEQKEQKKETTAPKENINSQNNTNNTTSTTTNTNTNNINDNKDKKNLIKKLVDSPQLRRETKVSDESKIGEKMEPNIEFVPVSNEIISNLTVQEVFDIYNLHFKGLCRMRKEIQKKCFLNGEKSKNDEIVKKIVELLCERIILVENQIDKLNPNKEFNMEEFFNKNLQEILNMFIEDNEINKNDSEWEDKFRQLVIDMFISLINELKDVYETGEDGAKTFIEFNILSLIENFIGQKYLGLIQSYDEDVINKFVENLFTIVKAEEIKKNSQGENDKNEKSSDNISNSNENKENGERPNLLSVEEIFRMACKDKERLDKEEKEKSEEEKKMKRYSDFYYSTSLFKS